MPSKKHYVPFVKNFPHFSTKGSDFLQGKLKTYFGPGQRPNMLATLFPISSVGIGEYTGDDRYANPSDWPKSGMVLRPPQVVWIDISVSDAGKIEGGSFARNGLLNPIDWHAAEADQALLVAAAMSAKSVIDGIRSNRTWVSVTNHVDHGFIEYNTSMGDGSWQDCGCCPIMAPSNRGDWFGTDFLEIWIGDHVYSADQEFQDNLAVGTYYLIPDQLSLILTPEQIAAEPHAAVVKHRLLDNHSKFFRYTTRLFDHGIADADIVYGNYTPFNPTPSTIFDEYASWANTHGIDIKHSGNTELINSGYLVNLIANHFGFDSTGKDL